MLKAATNRARIVRNALRRVVLNRTKRARGTMAGNRLNNIVRYYIEKKPVPPVRGLRVKLPLPGPATLSLQLKASVAATKAKKKYFSETCFFKLQIGFSLLNYLIRSKNIWIHNYILIRWLKPTAMNYNFTFNSLINRSVLPTYFITYNTNLISTPMERLYCSFQA